MPTRMDNRRLKTMAMMPVPPRNHRNGRSIPNRTGNHPGENRRQKWFSTLIWRFVVSVRKREKEDIPSRLKKKNFPEIMVQPMMKMVY